MTLAKPTGLGLLAAVVGGLLAAGPSLAAQNPAPAQKPTHARRVWTEDDLVALRTAADLDQREQDRKADEERASREAEEAARKAAAAHPQKSGKPAPSAPAVGTSQPIPTRLDDVQKRIQVVSQQVTDREFELRHAEDALHAAREDQKEEFTGSRTTAAERLDKARAELRALQAKLRELQPSS